MDVVYDLLVYAHVLGLSALIGGYFAVAVLPARSAATGAASSAVVGVPSTVMVWGARTQLVTGLALVGIAEAVLDAEVNQVKIGVKLVLALVAAFLVEKGAAQGRRQDRVAPWTVHAAGGAAMLAAAVAVLWT